MWIQVTVYYASSRTNRYLSFHVDDSMSDVILQVADASGLLDDVLMTPPNGKHWFRDHPSLPSPKEGGYVFTGICLSVCLSVCLSARLLIKLWTDFDEFCGVMGRGPWTNRLDFGGDPDHDRCVKSVLFARWQQKSRRRFVLSELF